MPAAERILQGTSGGSVAHEGLTARGEYSAQTGDRQVQPNHGRVAPDAPSSRRVSRKHRFNRAALMLALGIISAGSLVFIASRAFMPTMPTLQGEQLQIAVDQPPIDIPPETASVTAASIDPNAPLTPITAQAIVEKWLATKAAALGKDHAIDQLSQILVDPALSRWQAQAEDADQSNQYFEYQHQVQVSAVELDAQDPNQAIVLTQVTESANAFEDSQPIPAQSRKETLQVRYQLTRQDGQWRIKDWGVTQS
jgi:hypothetical protein